MGWACQPSPPFTTRKFASRAATYGEGGTAEMLLPDDALPQADEAGETTMLDGQTYRITLRPFAARVSASLPRLLSPREPRWATTFLPYPLAIAGLAWLGLRLPRRRATDDPRIVDVNGAKFGGVTFEDAARAHVAGERRERGVMAARKSDRVAALPAQRRRADACARPERIGDLPDR